MDLILSQKITLLLIVPQTKLKPLPDKDKQKSVRALGLHFLSKSFVPFVQIAKPVQHIPL